jgi:nucleoid-associated protein YgaU
MSAKKLLVAAVITSLLAGCGGNNSYQAPLPDGTYDSGITAPEDDYASGDYTGGDTSGDYAPGDDTDLGTDPNASPSPDVAIDGYTLKGFVSDANGKALAGATVSITGQSTLTDANGLYTLTKIGDTKVFLKVSKTGYDPVQNVTVEFSETAPSQTKDIKLAATDDDDDSTSATAGFKHELSFTGKTFKTVNAMVAADGNVYVLGTLDGLLFDSTVVAVYSADSGEEVRTIKKLSLFKSLPKDVSRLKVDDEEIVVSNGSESFKFSLTGDFLAKGTAVSASLITEVEDDERDIKYTIHPTNTKKIKVTYDGDTEEYTLDNLGKAKAIGLDDSGHLLVLDSTNNAVHQYSFETGD